MGRMGHFLESKFSIRWGAWNGWFDFQIGLLADFDEPCMGAFRLADEFGLRAGHGDVASVARLAVISGDGGGFFTQFARWFACVIGNGLQDDMTSGHAADMEPEVLLRGDAQGEQVVVFSGFSSPCLPSAAEIVLPE